jgi:hypothetical protein
MMRDLEASDLLAGITLLAFGFTVLLWGEIMGGLIRG